MLKCKNNLAYPWRVVLKEATDEQRAELIKWCQDNFANAAGRLRWIPPYREQKNKFHWRVVTEDEWAFLWEQDAILFNMVWSDTL